MRKEEFYVLNSLYNGSIGRAGCTYDVEETKALNDTDIYNKLVKTGYIEKESGSITKTGLEALEPYRVNNAVILAAGASTRFIPLSLEQPKGLFDNRRSHAPSFPLHQAWRGIFPAETQCGLCRIQKAAGSLP